MVRLHLFAEGQAEQTFANTVLKRHLANFGVYMQNPVLIAHARKKGRMLRGGGRNFSAMQHDINRFLKQESGNQVFFTTMIDLYALHKGFPGHKEAEKLRHDPYRRVETLERAWFDETRDNRFIPFLQLHEFEACLFSGVSQFAFFFNDANSGVAALQEIVDDLQCPELINDGQRTAPSKRAIEPFPAYSDLKATIGPQIAERIGLEDIRSQCPHFKVWIDRLEKLGARSP